MPVCRVSGMQRCTPGRHRVGQQTVLVDVMSAVHAGMGFSRATYQVDAAKDETKNQDDWDKAQEECAAESKQQ